MLLVTAALLGAVIGYLFLRARQLERAAGLSDEEQSELRHRDREITLIRQRVEEIFHGQQLGAQTQHTILLQQIEQIQHELRSRSRQIDSLQGQLRLEMKQREEAMNELRSQVREAVAAITDRAPRALPPASASAEAPQTPGEAPHGTETQSTEAWPGDEWTGEAVELDFSRGFLIESEEPAAAPEAIAEIIPETVSEPPAAPVPPPKADAPPPAFTPLDLLLEDAPASDDGLVPLDELFFGDSEAPAAQASAFDMSDFAAEEFGADGFDPEGFDPEMIAAAGFDPAAFAEAALPPADEAPEPPPQAPTPPAQDPLTDYDPFENLVQWTPLSFGDDDDASGDASPALETVGGDGFAHAEVRKAAPTRPSGAEDLTALPSISTEHQQALYDIGVRTVEEIARLSRADARRIARALKGALSEDDIMNIWVFEAQSVLFDRYQAELYTRRARA